MMVRHQNFENSNIDCYRQLLSQQQNTKCSALVMIANLYAISVCLKYDRHPSSVVHRMHAKCF